MRHFTRLLVLLALVTAACGDGGETADPVDFTGDWELVGGTLDGAELPLVGGWPVTMSLAGGTVGGTAACNGYGGRYDLDGATISVDEVAATEMACQPDVMESEAAFFTALLRPLTLSRVGEELTATGAGVELRFTLIAPVAAADVVGTVWQLHTIVQGDAATNVVGTADLVLAADGSFTGSTGCRDLTGTYQIDADRLTITSMQALGDCPADLAGQDSQVISVLEGARIEVDGDQLRLLSPGDDALHYSAA